MAKAIPKLQERDARARDQRRILPGGDARAAGIRHLQNRPPQPHFSGRVPPQIVHSAPASPVESPPDADEGREVWPDQGANPHDEKAEHDETPEPAQLMYNRPRFPERGGPSLFHNSELRMKTRSHPATISAI
jgi:hypothetical protein